MLTVLHILGNEPHESVQRNIYDESAFFLRHGVDVRFAYDPSAEASAETNFIDALRSLGATMYQLPYLSYGRPEKSGMSLTDAALTLRAMCAAYHIDVVHTHSEPAYRLACAARFLGVPVVHIFSAHSIAVYNPFESLRNRILSIWCDEFIAIDGRSEGALQSRFIKAHRIKRVNYGIDLSKWNGEGRPTDNRFAKKRGVFTILMIADSDEVNRREAYDAFADLVLRVLHDFDPKRRSGYGALRFIISTNSANGARYASELINTLDLNDYVKVAGLTDGINTDGEITDVNSGYGGFTSESRGGTNTGWSDAEPESLSKTEKRIKLRSFKYKAIERSDQDGAEGEAENHDKKNVFGIDQEEYRRQIYLQSDLCLYYSENRFFPYQAAEAISLNVPTVTNDMYFFASDAIIAKNAGSAERTFDAADTGDTAKDDNTGRTDGGDGVAGVKDTEDAKGVENAVGADGADGVDETNDADNGAVNDAVIDFSMPEAVAQRILALIYDRDLREALAASERQAVCARYDIDDMIIGTYDVYVRGLRV